ncbi:MAG: hypothetical protein IJ492_04365 [Clostridia bacterium]|nr:hypothetical protein [Clostridia bacterium]MBQ8872520.1 hypothetical protein [Clostridia bacterium]MBQ9706445.1 hypothetical protein [Clostridia bacterium]
MFKNPGPKLKTIAGIFFGISVLGGIISMIAMAVSGGEMILLGILMLFVVPLSGYIGGLGIYALGQIAEDTSEIRKGNPAPKDKTNTPTPQSTQTPTSTQRPTPQSTQRPIAPVERKYQQFATCPKCKKVANNQYDLESMLCPHCATIIQFDKK